MMDIYAFSYEDPVRIVATVIMLTGTAIHLLVIYLTHKKGSADSQSYGLFIKIYSVISILEFVCGWLLINRSIDVPAAATTTVTVYYGLGAYLGGTFCNLLEAFYSPLSNVTYILIPTGMALRALISFGWKMKKFHVVVVVAVVCLIETPNAVMIIHGAVPLSEDIVANLSEIDQAEVEEHVTVALVFPNKFESWYIAHISPNHNHVCAPVTFILGFLTLVRIKSLKKHMSAKTARIHKAFIWLLLIDALSLSFGFVVYLVRTPYLAALLPKPSYLALTLSFYASCLFSLIPTVQAFAMLCLIPYFRAEMLSWFGKKGKSVIVIKVQSTRT